MARLSTYEEYRRRQEHSRLRAERLQNARLKGTHTKTEWEAMRVKFDFRCVKCGTDEYNVERDHITPLCLGGSDSIDNIQPLCARCNSGKGPDCTDYRISFLAGKAGL